MKHSGWPPNSPPSRAEFEALKREVEVLRESMLLMIEHVQRLGKMHIAIVDLVTTLAKVEAA